MRRVRIRVIYASLLVLSTTTTAFAYRVLVHPACPDMSPMVSWRDYMSAKFPKAGNKVSGIAGVQFRNAKKINDPPAIGRLDTRFCYGVQYHGNNVYETWLIPPPGFPSANDPKNGLVGNPMKYEINVYGVLLLFNEAGEVLNRNGDVVGQLVCYLSNECGAY
jgi:hypothetical protein